MKHWPQSKPNPAQEWTQEFVARFFEHGILGDTVADIVAAHNAALAAATKDACELATWHDQSRRKLEQQLAEFEEQGSKYHADDLHEIAQLRSQLAAEREKHRPSEIAGIKVRWPYEEEMRQLREQLAAERENTKAAREARHHDVEIEVEQLRAQLDNEQMCPTCGMDNTSEKHRIDCAASHALAAEREQLETVRDLREHDVKTSQQLRSQLAAEREKRASIESINRTLAQAVDKIRERLAVLEGALKQIADEKRHGESAWRIAKSSLAKIKEGKA